MTSRMNVHQLVLMALLLTAGTSVLAGSGQEQVPTGPRPLAMGGAFRGVNSGVDGLYWNPAGLGLLRVSTIRGTTADLHGLGIQDNVVSLVGPLGSKMGLGLEWYHSGYSDDTIQDSLNRLSLGWGWRPFDQMSLGASFKFRQYTQTLETVEQGRGTGYGLDLGVLVRLHRKFQVGATLQDVGGTTLDYDDGTQARPFDPMAGIGLAYEPIRNLLVTADMDRDPHVGAEWSLIDALALRAGWTKDVDGLDGSRISAGFGVHYGPARINYAYQDHAMLAGTHTFGLSADFTLAPKLVEAGEVSLEPIFASFYKSYVGEGTGQIVVTSLADEPLEVTLSVDQKSVMAQPTRKTLYLLPGVAQKVEFGMVFDPSIVKIEESQPLQFDVALDYQSSGRRRQEERQVRSMVYASGFLNWADGVERAAAFVTPDHPVIDGFGRDVRLAGFDLDREVLNNRRATLAMALFDGVSSMGIVYTPDPLNPFDEVQGKKFAVDSIQYPADLLFSRTGDCDDMTVLMASLLENVGITTALVDVPGHIFLIFDTGIHDREQPYLGVDPELLVPRHGTLWVPMETTKLGQDFHVAWQSGAELINRYAGSDQLKIQDTLPARRRYPASLSAAKVGTEAEPPALDDLAWRQLVDRDLGVLSEWRMARMGSLEQGVGDVDDLAMALAVSRVHYRNQDFDFAEEELLMVPEPERDAAVWNNLGNTQVALGRTPDALDSFTRARSMDGSDPGIAINRGLTLYLMGRQDEGDRELAAAVQGSDGVADALKLLGLKAEPEGGSRADEKMALEQLTLTRIEELLKAAMVKVPEVTGVEPDSLVLGPDGNAAAADTSSTDGVGLLDSTAIPTDDERRVETGPAGSRGEQIEAATVIDLLYWKESKAGTP